MACNRITDGITRSLEGKNPIVAVLDSYNPTGSTIHVNFNTSRTDRWETDARRCHINWVILDSDWEAEFCRVAESHPQVKAYVKITVLVWKCLTISVRSSASIFPTLSSGLMTVTERKIC